MNITKQRVRCTIVLEHDLDRSEEGWGINPEDWVKHFVEELQEHNTGYCPQVLEIKTRLADSCWEFNKDNSEWELVPILDSDLFESCTQDERNIILVSLDEVLGSKFHPFTEASWRKEKNNK